MNNEKWMVNMDSATNAVAQCIEIMTCQATADVIDNRTGETIEEFCFMFFVPDGNEDEWMREMNRIAKVIGLTIIAPREHWISKKWVNALLEHQAGKPNR